MGKLRRHIDWFVDLPADEFALLKRAWFRLLWIWMMQKLNKRNQKDNILSLVAMEEKSGNFEAVRLAVIRAEKYHFVQGSKYIERLTVQSLLND